jgi:hypothetical protein
MPRSCSRPAHARVREFAAGTSRADWTGPRAGANGVRCSYRCRVGLSGRRTRAASVARSAGVRRRRGARWHGVGLAAARRSMPAAAAAAAPGDAGVRRSGFGGETWTRLPSAGTRQPCTVRSACRADVRTALSGLRADCAGRATRAPSSARRRAALSVGPDGQRHPASAAGRRGSRPAPGTLKRFDRAARTTSRRCCEHCPGPVLRLPTRAMGACLERPP